MDKLSRLEELKNKINYHADRYYNQDNPEISDSEYDILYDEYVFSEKESGVATEDSPTRKVGGQVVAGFSKHRHLSPLLSLAKAQNIEELYAWEERTKKLIDKHTQSTGEAAVNARNLEYSLEYKFDGLTINLTYDNGELINAATRGDGTEGENILEQIKTISDIPLQIEYKNLIEVQGEGIMRLSVLEEYNRTADEPLKNARNGVAGALRNLDTNVTKSRNLNAFMYNIGYSNEKLFDNHFEIIEFLQKNNINVSGYLKKFNSIKEIEEELIAVEKNRDSLDFLIDGMVLKIADLKIREVLGSTEKFPRWAIAYKFEAQERTTKIIDVEWNVGRTGKLTPTAILEPVDIGGVTVVRATLNNYGDILRKKIKTGARVFVRRSNDVIPEILGIAKDFPEAKEILKPQTCPACGFELIETGAHIFCQNSLYCPPQLKARLAHFVSRDAMNIEGFSEKTAEILFENFDIKDISQIYEIDFNKLATLKGYGGQKNKNYKKIENLRNAIEKSKDCSLSDFIFAIGIPNVGKKTAKDLCAGFSDLEAIKLANKEELTAIKDIGEETANSVIRFFANERNIKIIEKLKSLGVNPKNDTVRIVGESIFNGKTFVVTGVFAKHTRNEIHELIEQNGGKPQTSVSAKTDYLIAGENAGSKLKKAQGLGVKILQEKEFLNML